MRTKILAALAFSALALLAIGCGAGRVIPPSSTGHLRFTGKVHGGQNPVSGASVYVYAAGNGGYGGNSQGAYPGNASVSLLGPSPNGAWPTQQDGNGNYYVTSDSNGDFGLTGDFTCTAGQQVYIYAIGGDSGGGPNSADGFLAVLGNCPGSGDFSSVYPNVIVNEISTVAAAYVMAPFASDALHVSIPNTPLANLGLKNAFANANNLVDLTSGNVRTATPYGNGTVPSATIITLANILASCVNSANQTVNNQSQPSSLCSTLFSTLYAFGTSGTQATDTATEAIYIAQNPGANTSNLFTLPTGTPPFSGGLTSTPNDFSLSITYTSGGGINTNTYSPYVAIDQAGNAWFSDLNNIYVIGLSPQGVPLAGSPFVVPGLAGPDGLTLDTAGYLWVVDEAAAPSTLTKIDSSGNVAGSISLPLEAEYVASDGSGNIWSPSNSSASTTYYLSQISDTSVSLVQNLTAGGLSSPYNVAVDGLNDVWVINATGSLTEYMSGGTPSPNGPFAGGGIGLDQPTYLALDPQNNVWVQGSADSLSAIDNSGNALINSPFVAGNSNASGSGLAIDGQGHAFTLSYGLVGSSGNYYNYIMAYDTTGTQLLGANGLLTPQVSPNFIAIDGSGNLWMASNSGEAEMIGVATPVVTPLVANLVAPYSAPASKP